MMDEWRGKYGEREAKISQIFREGLVLYKNNQVIRYADDVAFRTRNMKKLEEVAGRTIEAKMGLKMRNLGGK